VGLGTTAQTTITNVVTISTNNPPLSPVAFDVSGLPAGAGYTLTDTNGFALPSSLISTNLLVTIFTTNIAEGLYMINLNASGGATNTLPLLLQAAHMWNGSLDSSNNWTDVTAWQGGVPTSTSDVVFGDQGAQTNDFGIGMGFTNIGINADVTIASLRFAQTGRTNNGVATNSNARPIIHTINIAPTATLHVTGTNGFSLLRDEIEGAENAQAFYPYSLLFGMTVNMVGGGKLSVSNNAANFAIMVGNQDRPTLNISNLNNFELIVSRVGLADYQLFPNYDYYNNAQDFNSFPRQFIANVSLARTNVITAIYHDFDNYTNELTRSYGFCFEDSERFGVGSSVSSFLNLGQTNRIQADGVCLVHASTGGGTVRFDPIYTNSSAFFFGTNGGRMATFAISDGAAGTNEATSNVKATIDFATGNGLVNILVDRFYIGRDRTLIRSNDNPTWEGNMTIGRGTVDANTAVLGFQEHGGRTDWTLTGGQAYRGYCRGDIIVTNGGLFRVNGNLTLGYTADNNPDSAAQQYNTRGSVTIYSNSTVMVSNIIADGGLNLTGLSQPRQNNLTMNQGSTMIVSNSIGDFPGLPVDNLTMTASTLWLKPTIGKTNVFVNTLNNLGSVPSVVKVFNVTGVSSYPTTIPLISYQSATPFLAADMSASGLAGVQGYIINNTANQTIDLFLTTNAPRNLRWTGNQNNKWDLTSVNWVTTNSVATAFALGDIVTFDDTSSITNIDITDVVVPNQSGGAGVTITNTTRAYAFNAAGGAIAGTASIVKQGPGGLDFNAAESGPFTVFQGPLTGSGVLGVTTIASNVLANYSGTMNGLTSTGMVIVPAGGFITGPVNIRGGWLTNSGTITASSLSMTNTGITNGGTMNILGTYEVVAGSTLANFGTINHSSNLGATRMNISGLYFGTGAVYDVDGTDKGNDGRVNMLNNVGALMSPGATPFGSIGSMTMGCRVDLNGGNPNNGAGKLLIEVDFNNPQTNDMILADRWNNIQSTIVVSNINPGAGTFASGQTLQIFQNNNGAGSSNFVDTVGIYPYISPAIPGPGLQWDLSKFRVYGSLGITNSPLIWDGTASATWDTNSANQAWQGGKSYSDRQGAIFDDTATGSTSITLANDVAPAGYGRETNIVGGVTNFITEGPAFSPGMVFSNSVKDYTISGPGKITGMTSLYKTGSRTLTMLTTNNFIGGVTIEGGTIAITNVNGLGVPATTANLFGVAGAYNQVNINGGGIRYFGPTNVSIGRFITTGPGNATFDVAGNEFSLDQAVRGPGALYKIGSGALVMPQSGNDYAGGTVISNGVLRFTVTAAGYGPIVVAGGTLEITNAGAGMTITNTINPVGTAIIANWKTNLLSGPWLGGGSITISNDAILSLSGSITGFSGSISLGTGAGNLRFNNATNSNNCTGSKTASFDLGSGTATLSNFNGAGLTYDLGALSGGANTILGGRVTNNTVAGTTYSIGANGNNTVFSGKIANGNGETVSVVKVGSGRLALNGANTYSGSTTVSNGTLGGTGVILGSVTVVPGGTLAPGNSIGTITINNSLTLGGTVSVEVSKSGASLTSDSVVGLTSVAYGGALVVSNIGPDALVAGNSFQLFNIGGTGNFTSITPALTAPLAWSFDPSTGILSVTSSAPAQPTLNFSNLGGGNIQFSWTNPGGNTFKLQSQTNSLSLGLKNVWSDYPGGGTSPVTVTVTPTNPAVFYRLSN
jgi:autotransporter-associated beta strand protein